MMASSISLLKDSTSAADRLVELYWERAYRFAAMITRNDQESADIAQEALAKVLGQIGKFDPDQGSFESWLWRIVLNVARDAGRAAGRRQALLDRIRHYRGEMSGGDAEQLALQHLSDEQVLVAVRRLPKRPRTVIALRFGAHLTYREIGDHLGMSEAAALMSTRRALDALRKDIDLKEALT
jgi:RNA polymerase sigma-70 factor (ECF subfamily)